MPTTLVHRSSWSRRAALEVLYGYTLVGAGAFGVALLFAPATVAAALGAATSDVYMIGIVGAVYAGFAVLAAIGFRTPDAIAPVFFLQLAYKTLWLAVVFAPRALRGDAPAYAWMLATLFTSYIVLDLLALPFERLRGRRGR